MVVAAQIGQARQSWRAGIPAGAGAVPSPEWQLATGPGPARAHAGHTPTVARSSSASAVSSLRAVRFIATPR